MNYSIDRWLVPPKPETKRKSRLQFLTTSLRPYQLTKPYMKNNYVYIVFISIFVLINVALFLTRLYEYRTSNGYVMVARACGKSFAFAIFYKSPWLIIIRLVTPEYHSYFHKRNFNTGQCLNFNCSFILVLMLRQCITFLRTHGFNSVLPLDQHIYLHKVTGALIGIFGVLHTVMHLLNFGTIPYYITMRYNCTKYSIIGSCVKFRRISQEECSQIIL